MNKAGYYILKGIAGLLPVLLLCVFLASCSSEDIKSKSTDSLVIFPPPPDTTRIQFLTSISTSKDITGPQSEINKFLFGESKPEPIVKPYGITTHGSKIYISDTGVGGLIIIDLSKKSFKSFIPSGKGQLNLPLNCSVDDSGTIYIADGNRKQIVVFDYNGNYIDAFGETENFKPTGVALDKGNIYVSSLPDHRIYVYGKDSLKLKYFFPDSEPGDPSYIYQPTNIWFSENELYVSDMGDYKVKIFSREGVFLRSVGSYGNSFGQLVRPKGIATDRNSNLFVVDAAFENVQIFNQNGKFLMHFGGPYTKPGYMWLPAGITIDYENKMFFSDFVDPGFELQYLILVANQYGPDKINVYGFVKPKITK